MRDELFLFCFLFSLCSSLVTKQFSAVNKNGLRDHYDEGLATSSMEGQCLEDCASLCIMEEKCASFYWNQNSFKCTLYGHKVSMLTSPADFEIGWILFEDKEEWCENDWYVYNGYCYHFESNVMQTWYQGKCFQSEYWIHKEVNNTLAEVGDFKEEESCESKGGRLAEIMNDDQNTFLQRIASTQNETSKYSSPSTQFGFWLGASDEKVEGEWIWEGSNTTMVYDKWKSPEPNNVAGNENCLALYGRSYDWVDYPCHFGMNSICEKPSRI